MPSLRFAAFLVAACAAFGAGCAAPCRSGGACDDTRAPGQEQAASDEDMVCVNEPVTGSHIVQQRCSRRSDVDERRQQDRATMEKVQIDAHRPVSDPRRGP
jgi:hypothetical protein